ncbi:MAG: hypothetical protein IPM29_13735 [Planctomycetes bacterium]|nr:hypothetical protein [Planctomycetota bacterium]
MSAAASASNGAIDFLAPGLIHALGNSLFAIRGLAQLLGDGSSAATAARSATILEACARADHALDVLRWLSPAPGDGDEPAPAGELLGSLARLATVSFRERGLRLALEDDAVQCAGLVSGGPFMQAVTALLRVLCGLLPPGVDATVRVGVRVDEAGDVAVRALVERPEAGLPFPLGLEDVAARLAAELGQVARAARVETDGPQALNLRVPAFGRRAAGPA